MNYDDKAGKVPEKIEKLISNIANVIKEAKAGETIMCNVDIEDCLVKGKTVMLNPDNKIDEGVLGVLELIKKEAEQKAVNFNMNLNSIAFLNNNLDKMFAEKEEPSKLERLFALNKDQKIKRIGQFSLDIDNQNALTIDSFSCNGNHIKVNKDYQDKIIQNGKLKKHKVNKLYLEDFREKTKNQNKVYVLHFDNEVSYFDAENIYNDKAYQFLPVPIKANCINVQNTKGAFLSSDVLTGLTEMFSQKIRKQDHLGQGKQISAMIRLHQEQRILEKQIQGMITECELNPDYQTDYELAKELLINMHKEAIAECKEAIDRNKQGLKNPENAYPEIRIIENTDKKHQEKIKVFQKGRLKDIEEYKENCKKQIKENELYIEQKNKEIEQITNIKSTATIKGVSDQYLKKAIFYLHRHINENQYKATYRLDKYVVLINMNQNYYKDLMINKLDTNTIKNILSKLELCQKNQYAINDFIVKGIIDHLRRIERGSQTKERY